MTLLSDTVSKTVSADDHGTFEFNELPPGHYELTATGSAPRIPNVPLAAYVSLNLDRTLTDQRLTLQALPQVTVSVAPFERAPGDIAKAQVLFRRSTAAGPEKAETKESRGPLTLHPGYWEFALAPSAVAYAGAFTTPDGEDISVHADGWNRVLIKPASTVDVKFAVASPPASIRGAVKGATGNGVPDVPVFLEPSDLDRARRLTELRWTRTDAQGRFVFSGLKRLGRIGCLAPSNFATPPPSISPGPKRPRSRYRRVRRPRRISNST